MGSLRYISEHSQLIYQAPQNVFQCYSTCMYYECPNQWPSVVVGLLLTHSTYMRALWKIDVHLISTLVNKSLYYYYYYYTVKPVLTDPLYTEVGP